MTANPAPHVIAAAIIHGAGVRVKLIEAYSVP